MSSKNLEQRVKSLEAQFEQLQKELRGGTKPPEKDWRKAVEEFAGDAALLSIFDEAMKLREADRKRARRRTRTRK